MRTMWRRLQRVLTARARSAEQRGFLEGRAIATGTGSASEGEISSHHVVACSAEMPGMDVEGTPGYRSLLGCCITCTRTRTAKQASSCGAHMPPPQARAAAGARASMAYPGASRVSARTAPNTTPEREAAAAPACVGRLRCSFAGGRAVHRPRGGHREPATGSRASSPQGRKGHSRNNWTVRPNTHMTDISTRGFVRP